MTIRSDGRRLIQLTMKPELYEQIRAHCARLDVPVTVWARELMKKDMAGSGSPPAEA